MFVNTDQPIGEKRLRFGGKRFKEMLCDAYSKPFDKQRGILLQRLFTHKKENEQQDYITVIGFRI